MYVFVDRPVDELNNAGRFVLWATRGWAFAVEQGTCPPLALSRAFGHRGLLPALPDFHIAMALIDKDARTQVAVAQMNCTHSCIEKLDAARGCQFGNAGASDHVPGTRFYRRSRHCCDLGWAGIGGSRRNERHHFPVKEMFTVSMGRKLISPPLANQISNCTPIKSASHL